MSAPELQDFLDALDGQDLAVALGLREALQRAHDDGTVERATWSEATAAAYLEAAHHIDGSGPDRTPHPGDDAAAVREILDERVLPRLESAGLVQRFPAGDESPAALRVTGAAGPLGPTDRTAALAALDRAVERLERERGTLYSMDTRPDTAVALENPSRFHAEGLTKVYRRRRVVSEVDIAVEQGEIVGLLGPNGAGKTTTFYMMVGLIPPDGGTVHLDGEAITDTPMYRRARKGIGYLAQEPSVFRKLSVEDNIRAILETLNLPKKEERQRLEQLLQELGLEGVRRSRAYSLSGGERRRLEITRALVQRPKFLLLDEPFAGIDPIAVNDIQQIVRGLKSRGIGVIISDHNVEQTLEIVDRAYIMYEGRIRLSGTVSELVWNDEAAEIYLGPTLTARMRSRYTRPVPA